jgi:hypothetical protein|tara:strand:+ start:30758 stop:31225 length:468 start_codon:yes stop_codon:yes gene_type:complete
MSAWMITDAHTDFLATAYVKFVEPAADPQEIGRWFLIENARSLRALYDTRHGMAAGGDAQAKAYRYRPWRGNIAPGDLYQQACCAQYQSCEHGKAWQNSASAARLLQLRDAAMRESKGTAADDSDDYPWGIDCHREAAQIARPIDRAPMVQERLL